MHMESSRNVWNHFENYGLILCSTHVNLFRLLTVFQTIFVQFNEKNASSGSIANVQVLFLSKIDLQWLQKK